MKLPSHNQRGYSLVELLVATAITAIIISAIYGPLTGALRIFRDVKSVSDNVQSKTPTISIMERYFDRWGKGVASTDALEDGYSCDHCPQYRHQLITGTQNGCDSIAFFGNIHGFGFLLGNAEPGQQANLVDCRLDDNAHYLWRDGDVVAVSQSFNSSLVSGALECTDPDFVDAASTISANATITAPTGIPLRTGDVLQRAPSRIEFSCDTTSFDGSQIWLRVSRRDLQTDGTLGTTLTDPIVPVNNFTVTPLVPPGCNAATGECTSVEVTIEIVGQTKKYGGADADIHTVTRIFSR